MTEYIHELPGWPDFTLGPTIAPLLIDVAHRLGILTGRVLSLGFEVDFNTATLSVLTEDVLKTSAIEGEDLNQEQVRSSVARHLGIDVGLDLPINREVEGIVDMLFDATKNCNAPLTDERLWGWHAAMFPDGRSGLRRITVGNWRVGDIAVVSGPIGKERVHFSAPEPNRVVGEMRRFLDWFNEPQATPTNLLLKSAIAHLWFVTIHPFDDGNGRIGRALTDLLLARADNLPGRFYSLSSQVERERKEYGRVLGETQAGTLDVTLWVEWYLRCLGRAIDSSEDVLRKIAWKTRLWNRLVGVSVNDRQRLMLDKLFGAFVGKLTAEKWAKITKVSKPTAVRDINQLLEHDVLVREEGGRSTSYRLAD